MITACGPTTITIWSDSQGWIQVATSETTATVVRIPASTFGPTTVPAPETVAVPFDLEQPKDEEAPEVKPPVFDGSSDRQQDSTKERRREPLLAPRLARPPPGAVLFFGSFPWLEI